MAGSARQTPVAFTGISSPAAGRRTGSRHSALGNSGAHYTLTISAIDLTAVSQGWPTQTLHQAFDAANGWKLSGTGLDYQCTQTVPVPVPGGGPGGPLAGHTLQCVASLVSQGALIASIIHSAPFVLV